MTVNFLLMSMSPSSGSFENYTAYQVSLFAVSHSSNAHHISSVMGYSLQGSMCFSIEALCSGKMQYYSCL